MFYSQTVLTFHCQMSLGKDAHGTIDGLRTLGLCARHCHCFLGVSFLGDFNAPDCRMWYAKEFTDSGGTRTHSLRISLLYQLEVRRAIHCATEPGQH